MYEFVNTTEFGADNLRPAEAMQINGQYLEDLVDGYRTLSVSGRELMNWEIDELETKSRRGNRFVRKRLPSRLLIVRYQLLTRTTGEFRAAFNRLNIALDQDQARIIFEDEPDMFFVGTPAKAGEVPEGTNNIVSEFGILCSNPHKHGQELVAGLNLVNPGGVSSQGLVRVTFRGDSAGYNIRHNQLDKEIRINWDFNSNDILEIDMARRKIVINGHVRMTAYDFRGQMPDILPGINTFATNVDAAWTEIRYRPRWL